MELKTTKAFVERAYKAACSDWKKEIEKEFPEAFPKVKVEVGNWYKMDHEDFSLTYIFVTSIENNEVKGYGFINGVWYNNTKSNIYYTWADDPDLKLVEDPRNEKELVELFQKEAEIRGLVEGVHIKSIWINNGGDKSTLPLGANTTFYGNEIVNRGDGLYTLYENGEWAEPVKEKGTVLKKRNAEILLSSLLEKEITIE